MNASAIMSLVRKDDRIILHADYSAFYASVFENENPALRSLPLAVQQKHIIVTCNYEARRRGLHKLQLISEAKKLCPDVVIVVGEQLDRFRDASKALHRFLEGFTWNKKVERLGFDEVFLDVTDIISYNQALLNCNDLRNAFFQLSRDDPTIGFAFDATTVAGYRYPEVSNQLLPSELEHYSLGTRLILGSHLAQHIRHQLLEKEGYASTFGVSTSKLLAKLVGNMHKPKGQTTLMPPYEIVSHGKDTERILGSFPMLGETVMSNVNVFMDFHDVEKIPGIGFKMAHKIRSHILSQPAQFDKGFDYGGTREPISVGELRHFAGMGPELLEKLLGGSGSERGIGVKIWRLINGIDDSEVRMAKKVPNQISIEDSYICLDTVAQVYKELRMLGMSLLKRMRMDLLEDDHDFDNSASVNSMDFGKARLDTSISGKKWIAYPKTIRLTTRPRPPPNSDGTRSRALNRISRSGPLPGFIFNLNHGLDALVEKLVQETLVPMFHRLHPEKQGWNLSLINVGVTNMTETATEDGTGGGRDIGRMFKRQETVLKGWKVEDKDVPPDAINDGSLSELQFKLDVSNEVISGGSEGAPPSFQNIGGEDMQWEEDEESDGCDSCQTCGASIPSFAIEAHKRYHILGD